MFCETQETMQIVVPDIAHRLLFKVNVRFRNLNFFFQYYRFLKKILHLYAVTVNNNQVMFS